MTRAQFRPPLWAAVLTAGAVSLFASLGTWQLHRGEAKQRLLEAMQRQDGAALKLSAAAASTPTPQRAEATGSYRADRQLLQDGQSHDGVPGYHVWTPLALTDGGLVVVDRGWVPQPAPASLDAPAARVTVSGWWRELPEPGLRLARAGDCVAGARFPAVVLYPEHRELDCLLGQAVAPGLLLLDPRVPGGFVREWGVAGFPPARHYAYAVQWFGLGVAAAVLFVKLNLKRRP
jgi:cytochrome oxidase assembly protein ShyY1